jgi:alpha-beta hydrolase superfamily lysophospholipase
LGFDLRGHGKSEGPRGHAPSYDALLDDIGRLLDLPLASGGDRGEATALRYPGLPRFLYGHSLGGSLVQGSRGARVQRCRGELSLAPLLLRPPPGS